MNMLSAMLWSWAGLSALSLLASALIVLAEVRLEEDTHARSCKRTDSLASR
jgi:hypothetical protein